MKQSSRARRLRSVLAKVKKLAVEYYALTGKPLGVTGEVAEYVAARALRLKLAPPRTAGYDATRRRKGRVQKIQIKGRAYGDAAKPGQRIGAIRQSKQCHIVMLVLLDSGTLKLREIWEAPMARVRKRLAVPQSASRARGVLGVSEFKRHCGPQLVWPRKKPRNRRRK